MNEIHDENTCETCRIIKEGRKHIERIRSINEQRIKEGKVPLDDDGYRIPNHCYMCDNIVWDGDKWCSPTCYEKWNMWRDQI